MQINRFCEGLLNFLQASPTPFHATQTMALALKQAGFEYLDEHADWRRLSRGDYFTTRNDASIIAFRLGEPHQNGSDAYAPNRSPHRSQLGFNMIGAHTDSPGLKVKPNPDLCRSGYWQWGVEVYGGALMHPWFDRDLSVAGRVHYLTQDNTLCHALVDLEEPIATIPSLAIHLNRNVNENSSINPQKHLLPILMNTGETTPHTLKRVLLEHLSQIAHQLPQEILDFDLFLYDTQAPRLIGMEQEFIASARLDNLLSCYIGLLSLLNADPKQRSLLVCNDHEEIGSQSACGAQGPFLADTLRRLFTSHEQYCRCIAQSFFVSVDNAHAIHPNYPNQHDPQHAPMMSHGPAIKINANQRYATTSETSAILQHLAQTLQVPTQTFVSRSDLACGSTIGPITSTKIGVKTVDIGIPQLGMHSPRELASKTDAHDLYRLLNGFLNMSTPYFNGGIRTGILDHTKHSHTPLDNHDALDHTAAPCPPDSDLSSPFSPTFSEGSEQHQSKRDNNDDFSDNNYDFNNKNNATDDTFTDNKITDDKVTDNNAIDDDNNAFDTKNRTPRKRRTPRGTSRGASRGERNRNHASPRSTVQHAQHDTDQTPLQPEASQSEALQSEALQSKTVHSEDKPEENTNPASTEASREHDASHVDASQVDSKTEDSQ